MSASGAASSGLTGETPRGRCPCLVAPARTRAILLTHTHTHSARLAGLPRKKGASSCCPSPFCAPRRFLLLNYDALCADPTGGVAKLVAFLGEQLDGATAARLQVCSAGRSRKLIRLIACTSPSHLLTFVFTSSPPTSPIHYLFLFFHCSKALVRPPSGSLGRWKLAGLAPFDAADVAYVAALGFDTDPTLPAAAAAAAFSCPSQHGPPQAASPPPAQQSPPAANGRRFGDSGDVSQTKKRQRDTGLDAA